MFDHTILLRLAEINHAKPPPCSPHPPVINLYQARTIGIKKEGVLMGDFFSGLFSLLFSGWLYYLREKHKVLYGFIMGCVIALFAGIAIFFYGSGATVKGSFMLIFALLGLVLLVYTLRQDSKPSHRGWNSWFDKHR